MKLGLPNCPERIMAAGRRFYEKFGIQHLQVSPLERGGSRIWGKAIDDFNFVNHPSLELGQDGAGSFSCDCEDGRRHLLCLHCVALALAYTDGEDIAPQAEAEPSEDVPEEAPDFPEDVPEETPVFPEDVPEEPSISPEEGMPETPEESEETPEAEAPECPEVPQMPGFEDPEEPEEPEFPEDGVPRAMEILFGTELETEMPIYWHPNDTEEVFHTNTGIIGTMGTGKTQFTKSLVTQVYRQQGNNFTGGRIGILIFDYKGDYNETKTDFVQATNARILKPYRIPYNPLALNPGRAQKPLLPMHTANIFKDTLSRIYGLGPKQQQTLMDCITQAYAEQGIDAVDSSTWSRKAPSFEQVYQIFLKQTEGRTPDSLTAAMNKLHQFRIFEEDPQVACSLSSILRGVVVMDLCGYDEDIQSLIVAITLDQFYAQMQNYGSSKTDGRLRQLRQMILVDEADNFMAQDFPSLRKIMKEGREFGVGVILSTQSLSHFVSGGDDYSRYVLTWVIHNVSDLKPRDVEYVFKLEPKSPEIAELYSAIKNLKKHESVVKTSGDLPLAIRDKAFWQLLQD